MPLPRFSRFAVTRRHALALLAGATGGLLSLGRGGAAGATPPSPLMFAATRLHPPISVHRAERADQRCRVSEVAFAAPDYRVRGVRFAFANWYCKSGTRRPAEFDTANPLILQGASLRVNGRYHALSFHGAPDHVLPPGGFALSDPLDLTIEAGATLAVRTADAVGLGEERPSSFTRQRFRGEACEVGAAFRRERLEGGTLVQNYSSGGLYGPCFMVAEGWDGGPVVLSLGDSIASGQEDGGETADARGNFGYIARGLDAAEGGRIPYAQMAVPASAPSETASLEAGMFGRRHALLRAVREIGGRWPFTHILSEHGVNDSYASKDWRALQAIMADWWRFLDETFGGAPIVQTTYTPRSLSPGPLSFTALDAQSPAQNNAYPDGARWRVADWIRRKPSPLTGVIDVQSWFSDADQPDRWSPRSFSATLAEAVEEKAATILLDAAPQVGELLILSPGDAVLSDVGEGALSVEAVSGNGPFLVRLARRTGKGHPAGSSVRAMGTRDGSHPSALLHREAAAVVVEAKRRGVFDLRR